MVTKDLQAMDNIIDFVGGKAFHLKIFRMENPDTLKSDCNIRFNSIDDIFLKSTGSFEDTPVPLFIIP